MTLYAEAPLSRASDPLTRFQAAESCKEFAGKHRAAILAALQAFGPMGASGIAQHTGMVVWAVTKRLPELQRAGLAEPTGRVVRSHSGRGEREWRAA